MRPSFTAPSPIAGPHALPKAPPARIEIRLDIADAAQFSCFSRADLGRGKVAVHMGDGDSDPLTLVLGGPALCDLYLELRRFLGELGGYGPDREAAENAVARLHATPPPTPDADSADVA